MYRFLTDNYSELNSLHFTSVTVHQEIELGVGKMLHFAEDMIENHHQNIMPLVRFVIEYRDGSITKSVLFQKYSKTQQLSSFTRELELFEDSIITLMTAIRTLMANLLEINTNLFNNNLYYITNETYRNTTLGQMLMVYENVPEYAEIIQNFSQNFEINYNLLIERHFRNSIRRIGDMSNNITEDCNLLITYMRRIDEDLRRFQESTVLDTTFYMQVSFITYYKSLYS